MIFIPGAIDNVGGAITFTADSLVGPVSGVSGSGILATVQFNALGAGSSPIALSNVALLNSTFGDISAGVVNGSVNVVPEPSTLSLSVLLFLALLARSLGERPVPGPLRAAIRQTLMFWPSPEQRGHKDMPKATRTLCTPRGKGRRDGAKILDSLDE